MTDTVRLTFVAASGTATELHVSASGSLMQAAVRNGVDGIVAQCGGACACATCHVYVAAEWAGRLPGPSAIETDMLDCVAEPRPGSRLSCQIDLGPELDGLVVEVPATQL